ncbi:MAG: N-acetylneuraminic acid mutarotase [Saprospiraceae bacterium]|jgi:N-acetylneuraminic acid mutarotase
MRYLILFSLFLTGNLSAQTWTELANMQEPVANNAVTTATVNGETYVYSFTGIDATKSCDGDHLRSFRYSVTNDTWEALPDIPDMLGGKIAAAASMVKNKIYVTGGYHLSPSCNEISSAKIHIFNPETNEWEDDGAEMLVPIDDQVQVVWKDSLIIMVTGWSNTTNVNDVQIYNPTTNEWIEGNSTPNQANYKVFGGSGSIVGDTIYYAGGARIAGNFPAATTYRKGYINPEDPTDITWSLKSDPAAKGYRMGASDFQGRPIWFGGSDVTYNFDGIAYNGSGGVTALDRVSIYNPSTGAFEQFSAWMPELMDLRGVAKISDNEFILAGGMLQGQEVSDKTFLLTLDDLPSAVENVSLNNVLDISPNPTRGEIIINATGNFEVEIIDLSGKIISTQKIQGREVLNLRNIPNGVYQARIFSEGKQVSLNKIVKIL